MKQNDTTRSSLGLWIVCLFLLLGFSMATPIPQSVSFSFNTGQPTGTSNKQQLQSPPEFKTTTQAQDDFVQNQFIAALRQAMNQRIQDSAQNAAKQLSAMAKKAASSK